jgi:hypothetical protein
MCSKVEVVGLTTAEENVLDENENAAVLAAGRSAAKRSVDTITFVWRRLLLVSDANFMEA